MAKIAEHNAANGIEFIFTEIRFEMFIKLINRGDGFDDIGAVIGFLDQVIIFEVVLVLDFPHNLFQHIFNSHQAGHNAVFIDDDGHMRTFLTEFPQQYIEALAFGDEAGGPDQIFQLHFFQPVHRGEGEQVFGQQNAHNLILVVAVHRKA